MNEIFRRTIRSFLRKERPDTRDEARILLDRWFSRYGLDPQILTEEVERHFASRGS